jgi:hypothetical protein
MRTPPPGPPSPFRVGGRAYLDVPRNRNLRFPHLATPFSFPLGTVGSFTLETRGKHPVFTQVAFLFFLGTFGFTAEGILVTLLFVTHVNILTSDCFQVSVLHLEPGTEIFPTSFFALQNVLLPFEADLTPFELTASVSYLVSCISGANFLILYVVTRFFTDGCFQAHRQVVLGNSLPFALSMNLETLSIDLGCFPLNVQYLSTAVGLRSWFAPSLFTVYT